MPLAAFPKCYLDAIIVKKTLSLDQWIENAATQLDIDGLEFYWGFAPRDTAAIAHTRELLKRHKMAMPMMCYSPDFIKPDPAERKQEIEKQRHVIDVTAELGGSFCRVLSGQRRADVPIPDGVKMAADCIIELIPYAAERKIVLILENHYKDGFWQFPEFAQKIEVFLQLLNSIPHSPWFGVNYDPSNAIIAGDDPIEMLEAVKDRVVTMHASDRFFEGGTASDLLKMEAHPQLGYAPILRHGVIGKGLNDYDKIFSILKSVGFKGWVSIEDGEDASVGMEHLRQSALFLRQKMAAHGLK